MKKLLLTAAALAALTATAHAQDDRPTFRDYFEYNPYIGADFQHTDYKYDHVAGINLNDFLDDTLEGGDIHIGNRFNKFVGLELGGFYNPSQKKSNAGISTKVKTYGGTLDLLGYLPLGPQEKFDLIGTGGITYTHAKLNVGVAGLSGSDSDTEWGYRAGGGLQFHVTPQFNIRGLARYQSADFDDIAKHAITYTIGANFEF